MIRFSVYFTEQKKGFHAVFTQTEQEFSARFEAFQVETEIVGGEIYTGDYTVIPQVHQQTLNTKNKSMSDDVTVEEIPYAEVSNTSGGTTATIG